MTRTTTELVRDNVLAVFGERDTAARAAALEEIYTEDVTMYDAEEVVRGRAELAAKVQRLLDDAPDFVFTLDGPAHEHHGLAVQAWGLGPAGAPPVVTGFDVAAVRDGRIATMHTFLTS